jgi:hypothetical protein
MMEEFWWNLALKKRLFVHEDLLMKSNIDHG